MSLRKLKWLALLGPLGVLGLVLHQNMLSVLFGFWVFSPLFWADERAEANLGRAAAVAYTATLLVLVVTFFLVAAALARKWTSGQVIEMFGLMLAATYAVHVLVFMASYHYFEARGT